MRIYYRPEEGSPPLYVEHSSVPIILQPPERYWRRVRVPKITGEKPTHEGKRSGEFFVESSWAWEPDPDRKSEKPEDNGDDMKDVSDAQYRFLCRGLTRSQATVVVTGIDTRVKPKKKSDPQPVLTEVVTGLSLSIKTEEEVLGNMEKRASVRMQKLKERIAKEEAAAVEAHKARLKELGAGKTAGK